MNKENSRSRGRARQHAGRVRYPERQRDADSLAIAANSESLFEWPLLDEKRPQLTGVE